MVLLLCGFVVISICGLLMMVLFSRRGSDGFLLRRFEYISVVMTFLINAYLVGLVVVKSDFFIDDVGLFLGSGFMVFLFFFAFFISFFYMLFYSMVVLFDLEHVRFLSFFVFIVLSVNYVNVLYQFYFKLSLSSFDAVGSFFAQFVLIYVTFFSIYQVFMGRNIED
jgi:hypothetical protein